MKHIYYNLIHIIIKRDTGASSERFVPRPFLLIDIKRLLIQMWAGRPVHFSMVMSLTKRIDLALKVHSVHPLLSLFNEVYYGQSPKERNGGRASPAPASDCDFQFIFIKSILSLQTSLGFTV